jgi:hypothetical protein
MAGWKRDVDGVRTLARAVVPELPDAGSDGGDPSYATWEHRMIAAAKFLAAQLDHDCALLSAAIGPPIEVGRNVPWRVLLQIALMSAHATVGTTPTPTDRVRLLADVG